MVPLQESHSFETATNKVITTVITTDERDVIIDSFCFKHAHNSYSLLFHFYIYSHL